MPGATPFKFGDNSENSVLCSQFPLPLSFSVPCICLTCVCFGIVS